MQPKKLFFDFFVKRKQIIAITKIKYFKKLQKCSKNYHNNAYNKCVSRK